MRNGDDTNFIKNKSKYILALKLYIRLLEQQQDQAEYVNLVQKLTFITDFDLSRGDILKKVILDKYTKLSMDEMCQEIISKISCLSSLAENNIRSYRYNTTKISGYSSRALVRDYSIVLPLNLQQLEQLLSKYVTYKNKTMYIISNEKTVGVSFIGGKCYYYDTDGSKVFTSLHQLVEFIFEMHKLTKEKYLTLGLVVISLGQVELNYPKHENIFNELKMYLQSSDYKQQAYDLAGRISCEDSLKYFKDISLHEQQIQQDLISSVIDGDVVKVSSYLKDREITDYPVTENGMTALMYAVGVKNVQMVEVLLKNPNLNNIQDEVNKKNSAGKTVLMQAIDTQDERIIKVFLTDKYLCLDALVYAVISNKNELAESIITNHAHKFDIAVFEKAIDIDNIDVMIILLQNKEVTKFDINSKDSLGKTILEYASINKHEEMAKLIIKQSELKFDENSDCRSMLRSVVSSTPVLLDQAIDDQNEQVLELILTNNEICLEALTRAVKNKKKTMIAFITKHFVVCDRYFFNEIAETRDAVVAEIVVKRMLALGFDVNQKNKLGKNVLMEMIENGHTGMAKLIIAHSNIKLNDKDNQGNSALMIAAYLGYESLVRDFFQKDFDFKAKNLDGWNALMLAVRASGVDERYVPIIKTLMEKGIDVDVLSADGWTALMVATAIRRSDIVEHLLQHGANAAIKNSEGKDALYWAVTNQSPYIVGLLNKSLKK